MSPTQRSLAMLRQAGYVAEVVERFYGGSRHDLWGWCDILAVRYSGETRLGVELGEILAVQTTTSSNMSARIKKITESDTIDLVRSCGIMIHVHGWAKKKGRWECRSVDLS